MLRPECSELLKDLGVWEKKGETAEKKAKIHAKYFRIFEISNHPAWEESIFISVGMEFRRITPFSDSHVGDL